MDRSSNPSQLEAVAAGASRLAGKGPVRSVTVVVGRELSNEELGRCHAQAASRGVSLTADRAGLLRFRAGHRVPARGRVVRIVGAVARSLGLAPPTGPAYPVAPGGRE